MYKEAKYRTILEATEEELKELRELSINDEYKPKYHIHPQFGLLNDPNGLAYYNGKYHVFYQWYPFDASHGMKHWDHVSSIDFVNWKREQVAIVPLEKYESHGAYSGNAIEVDGNLHLYYTGNIKYNEKDRYSYQNLAIMDKKGNIKKYENNPVIDEIPKGYTGHVRDAKVFRKDDKYFMLLGAQTSEKKGAIIVYESENSFDWSFKGELDVRNIYPEFGYMWECPDYINLDGEDVLIFSPQGLEAKAYDFKNIYNVIYAIGEFDLENLIFEVKSMNEFEKGFDFYAPQTFKKDSKTILLAWAGMGEISYPTDKNKWAHCLSFPRELSVKDNKLLQMPVCELNNLRYDKVQADGEINNGTNVLYNEENIYELDINIKNINSSRFGLVLFASENEGFKLEFDKIKGTVSVDRSNFENKNGEEYGSSRIESLKLSEITDIKVLADNSILEIFINDGTVVFTSRVFPKKDSSKIKVYSDNSIEYKYSKYKLKQGIEL